MKALALITLLIAALAVVGTSDYEEAKASHERYCEMVNLWNDNAHLSKEKRPGWPPYKGECDE